MYKIKKYTYDKAKDLGVKIKPSTKKNKKIDVYKDNKFITSIGDSRYNENDYASYIDKFGIDYANEKKRLYYKRHGKDIKGITDFYAKNLLW